MDFNFEIICPYSSMSGYYFQSLLQLFLHTYQQENTKTGGGKVLQESFKEHLFFSLFREVVKNGYRTARLSVKYPFFWRLPIAILKDFESKSLLDQI